MCFLHRRIAFISAAFCLTAPCGTGSNSSAACQTLCVWWMLPNKLAWTKITVRSVSFTSKCTGYDVEHRRSVPSLSSLRCQHSTTQPWPRLLSKWQTVWQSQAVGNLSWRPLKEVAPAPPWMGQWQTDLGTSSSLSLHHVLPSSVVLVSALHTHSGQRSEPLTAHCFLF